jgi:hypothetical protein
MASVRCFATKKHKLKLKMMMRFLVKDDFWHEKWRIPKGYNGTNNPATGNNYWTIMEAMGDTTGRFGGSQSEMLWHVSCCVTC